MGSNALDDISYMRRAIELAKKGAGYVAPNPMVGAVIVKDDKIIGEGYHERYGELHAERNALASCEVNPAGATMYVTLEPCCHYGKTPPCTEAIIGSGITRVVIGTLDVNPIVAGNGARILRENNIHVEEGLLEDECRNLNKIFNKFMQEHRPYVIMKYAMTLDGKITTSSGESKWITGSYARYHVHMLRKNLSGIMVGVGTVIADNPELTSRLDEIDVPNKTDCPKNPIRIICDTNLRTPLDSTVVQTAGEIPTIIATSSDDDNKCRLYEDKGCTIIRTPMYIDEAYKNATDAYHGINLDILMSQLAKIKIDSILLEGGPTLNYSALSSRIVDEVHVHIAPKVFGGNGKVPVAGEGIKSINDAFMLKEIKSYKAGDDFIIENKVIYN